MSAWLKVVGAALRGAVSVISITGHFRSRSASPTATTATTPGQPPAPQQQALTQQQIQQLVPPIALYPDTLLAQVLTASTYPLEVAMAAHWSEKNPNLKETALEEAMQKEPWDPCSKV